MGQRYKKVSLEDIIIAVDEHTSDHGIEEEAYMQLRRRPPDIEEIEDVTDEM